MTPFLRQNPTVLERTPQQSGDSLPHAAKVIEFPTTPVFAEQRKRGAQSGAAMKRSIASYRPELIEDVEFRIFTAWRRGVPIAWIAKMFQLTVRQCEACIWCRLFPVEFEPARAMRRAA